MVLETHGEEFHVPVWRVREEKLGLRVAVSDNTLRIDAVTGSQLKLISERCRSCKVSEIIGHQLMESDQVVSVNGKTALADMLAELHNTKVECLHIRVRRHLQEAAHPQTQPVTMPAAAATRPEQSQSSSLRPGPPHLQTVHAGIETGPRGLPMQTPNGTPVPRGMPPLATPQGAQHMRSADLSEIGSVATVTGTERTFNAAAAAAEAQARAPVVTLSAPMANGSGPYPEPGPSEPAASAGPPAQEQPAAGTAATAGAGHAGGVAAPSPGPSQIRVVQDYDPPNEPENGYLGVVEGTMIIVQPGSHSPADPRARFKCDYVYAWKADQQDHKGWLPVDILAAVPA